MLEGIGAYMQSLLNHWIAWGTGSFIVLALYAIDTVYGWRIPKPLFVVFLAIAFSISGFQAWQEQYRENEASRMAGSLSFTGLQMGIAKEEGTKKGALEIDLNLKNLQNRLIEYHMDSFEFTVGDKNASSNFVNKGGYVYANSPTTFRSSLIPVDDTSQLVFTGTLKYAINYHVVGSKEIHHSSKSINFSFYTSPAGRLQHLFTAEHED
jgi:hypothetical protein